MDTRTLHLLSKLAALSAASSHGYAVAAESVRNRGLKIILQSYARQRSALTDQLVAEIARLGGKPGRHRNPLAALHRGWINLKATMSIGAENAQSLVLDEVARGERVANKRFQAALSAATPADTHRLLEQCARDVQAAQQHIDDLRGAQDDQLVVRLVDTPGDLARALAELKAAGFRDDQIDTMPAGNYLGGGAQTRHGTMRETVAATALLVGAGGALLGVVMAALSLVTQDFDASQRSIALTTAVAWPVIGGFIGALFGVIVGGMLGQGISEQDSFLTADSVEHGDTLVMVHCQPARARQASEIMYRVNVAARSERAPEILAMPASAG